MCRISLRFAYFYDDGNDFFDISTQLATVTSELKNKLNNNIDFVNCEIEKCCIGLSGFCKHYKYNHFAEVYVFTVYWSVQKPHYRLRRRHIKF